MSLQVNSKHFVSQKRERERERCTVHSDDVARGIVVEGAVTRDRALKAFPPPFNRHIPIPFSSTWIFPKIPVFLPQLFPYLFQCIHCAIKVPKKNKWVNKSNYLLIWFSRNCRKTKQDQYIDIFLMLICLNKISQVHNKQDSKSLLLPPKRPTKEKE